jgi:hypothetical protein
MPQTPKEKPDETSAEEREGKYYYDDAHGYEDFDPETDDEDADEEAD